MKEGFSLQEQQHILRGKQILKQLWKKSGLKQADILQHLDAKELGTKVSTLSTWFSESNYYRPKEDYIEVLVALFCTQNHSAEQIQEILDELLLLFGYRQGPLTSEMILNRVAAQISENLERTLHNHQHLLTDEMSILEGLLDEIEPKVLEYDKGYPVIYVEKSNKILLKQLLGKDKEKHGRYEVEDGYEIPFTQIRSQEVIAEIINNLNEGSRLLRAYIDRHLEEEEGVLFMDFSRVEDFMSYTWEIADRLLNNNRLCQAVPILKRTLLRVMTICCGIRYFLENQTQEISEIKFQNMLARKGKTSQDDLNCSVAVYMGLLSRQLLKSSVPPKIKRGLGIFQQAAQLLQKHHHSLNTEQEVFYYKKELANLCYDVASAILLKQDQIDGYQEHFDAIIKRAYQYYIEVLQQPNLFYQGLTEQRSNHIRMFYAISFCWISPHLEDGVSELNKLTAGEQFNESFWQINLAKAIGYSALYLRAKKATQREEFKQAAAASLHKAMLVHGFMEKTEYEVATVYALKQVFPQGTPVLTV